MGEIKPLGKDFCHRQYTEFYGTLSMDTMKPKISICENNELSKRRIIKNLLVLSIASLKMFCAYEGLVMLQSTMNSEKGIGAFSIALQYAIGILSAFLLPKYLIQKFGCKVVMIACFFLYFPFIVANAYPHWIMMILASIPVGFGNSQFWAALCFYLNELSILYTKQITRQNKYNSLKYNKILAGGHLKHDTEFQLDVDQCSQDIAITLPNTKPRIPGASERNTVQVLAVDDNDLANGTLTENDQQIDQIHITYRTTAQKSKMHCHPNTYESKEESTSRCNSHCNLADLYKEQESKLLDSTTARFFAYHGLIFESCHIWSNLISYYILSTGAESGEVILNSTCVCGADFCNDQATCLEGNLQPPKDEMRYILTAVFLVLGILSVLMVGWFLDNVGQKRENISLSVEQLSATFKFMKTPEQLLIAPITIYIGILQGFSMSDYTQAYVGCAWGIKNVALVNSCFGLGLSLFASVSGWFVKYTGRKTIFLFTEVVNIATTVTLLLWQPDAKQPAMMFIIGALLGFILGTFWAQLRAFYGILFKGDEEVAFGSYQIWHSVGCVISFACSSYVCTITKIYAYITFSVVSIIGYLLVERCYIEGRKE